MVPATRAANNIENTAESLQEDLARLELQKRALERELAAVAAHLDSVQRALGALSVLMSDPTGAARSTSIGDAGRVHDVEAVRETSPSLVEEPPVDTTSRSRTPEQQQYGQLTEQIIDFFAHAADSEVRARDVAAALGRDTDSGSINAVRSTLDRLVGTSRIKRAGRGLYRAL
ncbi:MULTISPECIES: hypothetical protein [unclassified Streptomyces]|uniref:hypothetical protein n=1 Tax=unclassified Streptomyces TaxID=2593676 RepID=UPI002E27B7DC|nr:hypothetical protein [Streptomyces sp. NBC_00228]